VFLSGLAGIGPAPGARILAEIVVGRFANGSKLARYAGLAPVSRARRCEANQRADEATAD